MGRMPASWAGQPITARWPYAVSGELSLTSSQAATQFPDSTFMNGVDKPFEIHRMIPRVYALDSEGVLLGTQPDQELLLGLVRANFLDLGHDQLMTKVPTLLGVLLKGSSERSWEFAEPMYLVRSQQIQVTLQALAFPVLDPVIASLVVAIDFQGFMCVVAPPTGNR